MADKSDLPYIVSLIDDETKEVRSEVLKALSNYGDSLEEDLLEYTDILNTNTWKIIQPLLNENRKKWLIANWDKWYRIKNEYQRLETAMELIIRFQNGVSSPSPLAILLDKLADEFTNTTPYGNEIDLANFLFIEKGIRGNSKDYHNPLNSNLVYVIKNKKGLPISLSIIYLLTGVRAGFVIRGCNFPGHFLSKIYVDGELILVDGFHGGRLLYEKDIADRIDADSLETVSELIHRETTSAMIIKRVLNNLVTSYKRKEETENASFFNNLIKTTPWDI